MANTIITQNGELVDYCSSISNTGIDPCLNTIGLFNLPAGLSVDSVVSVTTGIYDPVSGLWQVGEIGGAVGNIIQTEIICLKLRIDDISLAPFEVTTTYSSSCSENPIDNVSSCIYETISPTSTPTATSTPNPTVNETKGACCLSDNCICTNEIGCTVVGGTFMGIGTECNDDVCEKPSCLDNICNATIEKTKKYDLPNLTTPTSTFTIPLAAGEQLVDIIIVSANGTIREEGIGVYDYKVIGNTVEFNTQLDASGPNPCYGKIVYTVSCSLGLELGCDCPDIEQPTPTPTSTTTVTGTPTITPTITPTENAIASLTLIKTSSVTPAPSSLRRLESKPTRKRKAGRPKGSKDKVKRKSRTKK